MKKENIETIGKWVVILFCGCMAAFFVGKGDKDAAFGFGAFGGLIMFLSFLNS